jgi:cell division protein FtsB
MPCNPVFVHAQDNLRVKDTQVETILKALTREAQTEGASGKVAASKDIPSVAKPSLREVYLTAFQAAQTAAEGANSTKWIETLNKNLASLEDYIQAQSRQHLESDIEPVETNSSITESEHEKSDPDSSSSHLPEVTGPLETSLQVHSPEGTARTSKEADLQKQIDVLSRRVHRIEETLSEL